MPPAQAAAPRDLEPVLLLWSLTSVQVYDQLVVERGLSLEGYAAVLRTSLRTTLTSELAHAGRPR